MYNTDFGFIFMVLFAALDTAEPINDIITIVTTINIRADPKHDANKNLKNCFISIILWLQFKFTTAKICLITLFSN